MASCNFRRPLMKRVQSPHAVYDSSVTFLECYNRGEKSNFLILRGYIVRAGERERNTKCVYFNKPRKLRKNILELLDGKTEESKTCSKVEFEAIIEFRTISYYLLKPE